MRRPDRARTLIVMVLAFLAWTIGPTIRLTGGPIGSARAAAALAQKTEVEKAQAETEQKTDSAEKDKAAPADKETDETDGDKKAESDGDKKAESDGDKKAESGVQKKAEKKAAKSGKDADAKPAKADAASEDRKTPAKKGASGATEPVEKKAANDAKVPSMTEAAKIVLQQVKAAAAAFGIKSDETEDEKPKRKRRKKKKAPQPPMYRMRDGTRIAGHADVKTLHVTTAYGSLEVPIADIVQVRFSSPKDAQLGERIRALVEQLGSDEFDLREEASDGLRGIGVAALDAVREAARSEDQEVKTRAEKLVAELEEELEELEEDQTPFLVALRGEEDEVVTLKFTAVGRVELTRFSVSTPYGQLELDRDDILSIVFRPPPFRQHTFKIGGTRAYAGNNKWVDTGLKLTQGGFLKIIAAGSLNLSNYRTNCSPDGAPGVPTTGLDSFPVGALVGKIGAKGKAFLIGSEYEGTANATGNLRLGISFKSGSMRGQFEVEVEVEVEVEIEAE